MATYESVWLGLKPRVNHNAFRKSILGAYEVHKRCIVIQVLAPLYAKWKCGQTPYFAFAFDSAHEKYGVRPGPKSFPGYFVASEAHHL